MNAVPLVYHRISDFKSTENLIRVLLIFIVGVHVGWRSGLLWYASKKYHSSLVHCAMYEPVLMRMCMRECMFVWVCFVCMCVVGMREYGWARVVYIHECMRLNGWRRVVCLCLRGKEGRGEMTSNVFSMINALGQICAPGVSSNNILRIH